MINGEKLIYLECGGEDDIITADEILVGVGRAPNVEGMGLETAGVEYDERKGVDGVRFGSASSSPAGIPGPGRIHDSSGSEGHRV